jgi:hypothetical protein
MQTETEKLKEGPILKKPRLFGLKKFNLSRKLIVLKLRNSF